MNVGEVLNTVEQSLLSRQLSSLERFILCQSWLGRGYSQMAPDCAYSIAHIKDIGSQLWQALSKALGEKVTKKNLFLVLKQYLLSRTGETVTSDPLSATLELVEAIDPPLTSTTNQLPVATDNTEAENNLKAPVTQNEPTILSGCLSLDSLLYINHLRCLIRIKAPRLPGKSSLVSRILNRATCRGYKTVYLDFQEADVTVSAELNRHHTSSDRAGTSVARYYENGMLYP